MKKIPNGKEIIRQEIEKRMRMLEELNMRALQDGAQRSVANDQERIVDALVKCGNKSFFMNQFKDGVLQDSAQHQIAISQGYVTEFVENPVEK